MPLKTAQSLGWNLARTLMTIIVLFKTNQGYSVMPLSSLMAIPIKSCANMIRSPDKLQIRFRFRMSPPSAMAGSQIALWRWWRARPLRGRL